MAIQDIRELMLLDIQAVIKQIAAMAMFVTTMETILETLVVVLQNLDNVNNYFRAVCFEWFQST